MSFPCSLPVYLHIVYIHISWNCLWSQWIGSWFEWWTGLLSWPLLWPCTGAIQSVTQPEIMLSMVYQLKSVSVIADITTVFSLLWELEALVGFLNSCTGMEGPGCCCLSGHLETWNGRPLLLHPHWYRQGNNLHTASWSRWLSPSFCWHSSRDYCRCTNSPDSLSLSCTPSDHCFRS